MTDAIQPYASHETDDGFTVESNTATVEQLEAEQQPVESAAPEDNGDEPVSEPEPEKLTPFRKGAKPRDDAFARMKQATDKLAEANRLREAAETKLRDYEARQQHVETRPPAPVTPQEAPKAGAKFPSYDAYLVEHPDVSWDDWNDAKIDFVAEQKLEARDRQADARRQQQELERIHQAHGTRMAAMATKYPDYEQVRLAADQTLAAAGVRELPDVLIRAVVTSDRSDDLVYFLGTHPDEAIHLARRFANRPVTDADLVQDVLLAKLTAGAVATGSATPTRSSAKPPVNPVGGAASVIPAHVDDLDFGPEYVRRMNKRDREQGKW